MSFLDRLRPWFIFVAAAPALMLVNVYGPIGWENAFLLIIYGIWIGDIDRQVYPARYLPEDIRPFVPWNQLDAGDKVEHFLTELFVVTAGLVMIFVSLLSSKTLFDQGPLIAGCLFMVGMGAWQAYRKWHNRWSALEVE